MRKTSGWWSWVVLGCLPWSAVAAESPRPIPLSAAELARCAERVQTLRAEAPRLLAENAQLDRTRDGILAGRAALEAEAETLPPQALDAWLALRSQRQAYNDEARVLNAAVARLRSDIAGLAQVRSEYDAACARRPFDRRDLEALSDAAQAAMRAGLADIMVPELVEGAAPLAGDVD